MEIKYIAVVRGEESKREAFYEYGGDWHSLPATKEIAIEGMAKEYERHEYRVVSITLKQAEKYLSEWRGLV